MAKLFETLLFWRDSEPRSGPENMAVDQWLLESTPEPVLRVYRWAGDWLSLGYFGRLRDADALRRESPGLQVVRRPTGGGLVDHRRDRTYTLAIPRTHPLATLRGAESYRAIHAALAEALRRSGTEVELVTATPEASSPECFVSPVQWDLVDRAGGKVAGAGQRRTRHGLLHQGSVQGAGEAVLGCFAEHLGEQRLPGGVALPTGEQLAERAEKFARPAWLERR